MKVHVAHEHLVGVEVDGQERPRDDSGRGRSARPGRATRGLGQDGPRALERAAADEVGDGGELAEETLQAVEGRGQRRELQKERQGGGVRERER